MSKKKHTIAIFTTTRAEYGLFYPLIKEISKLEELNYLLFVGGTHLATEHGKTIQEIFTNTDICISDIFDFILNEDSPFSLAQSLSVETMQLSYLFRNYSFDLVMILGDRIELLPIVENAIIFNKPIAHLYGGEKTLGAIDEQIRNMISKAAHIHFTSCNEYAKNLTLIGEDPKRIHIVGSLAFDNMVELQRISKEVLFQELGLDPNKPLILLSYHPVTLEMHIDPKSQIENIFAALNKFKFQVVITGPNIDPGHTFILDTIKRHVQLHHNYRFVESLGITRFHSLLPHCLFIIGNSSSGIVEVPYYKIPTINIGDRQKGRLRHPSIIDVGYKTDEIESGIEKALDSNFRKQISTMPYLFGDGKSAIKIVQVLKKLTVNDELIRK